MKFRNLNTIGTRVALRQPQSEYCRGDEERMSVGVILRSVRGNAAHPGMNWVLSFTIACVLLATSSVPAVGQTLATYQFTGGWATFGLALPQGAAASGVRVGSLETQTDVKT